MTDRKVVKNKYPDAFAIEWQGWWRVYKRDLSYDDRLTNGYETEAEAWEVARSIVEEGE